MNINEFEKYLNNGNLTIIDGGKTCLGTYVFIPKVRLSSSSNRLNSSWIRAQYIILNEIQTEDEIKEDVKKWTQLLIYPNQYFLVNSSTSGWKMFDHQGQLVGNEDFILRKFKSNKSPLSDKVGSNVSSEVLRAMRTKPFLLLAGISGTGKSRIVKQMAFDSCPDIPELRKDPISPGNYCLVEVKPNWHDSTELLGYSSRIGGAHYQLTNFVRFLVKAMQYPEVPFFLCLDEMNLAPVEQYFAEFLSVLESRTKIDGHIVSEPLIKPDIFSNPDYELKLQDELFGLEIKEEETRENKTRIISGELPEWAKSFYDTLRKDGLRIPENVIVIGTVNMDETTHQFSRKVIDRAMTIEMNLPDGDPFMDFFTNTSELKYRETPTSPSLYLASETKASEAVNELEKLNAEKTEWLKREVAKLLNALNTCLEETPFKVAYRVQNELMLYFHQLLEEIPESQRADADWNKLLGEAFDQIMMMKVLPRVEGDNELLETSLDELSKFCQTPYILPNAAKKIKEMKERLEKSQFTSFWP